MLYCTVASSDQTQSNPPRPTVELEFPVAEVIRSNGTEYRCFAADGEGWKRVAHIHVDYQAFFLWTQWADRTINRTRAERNELSLQLNLSQQLLATSEHSRATFVQLFNEERGLRLKAEARLDHSSPRWLTWGLGGLALAEIGAIIALVAAGAAQ